jgi:hypothetical protein
MASEPTAGTGHERDTAVEIENIVANVNHRANILTGP